MKFWSRRQLLVAGTASIACPAVLRASPLRLRVGHGLPTSHPVHPSIQYFASIVREKTGGAIEIAIFPDGQIGQEMNLLAQLRAGKLDFLKVSASVLERSASAYRVLNVAYVFRDQAHWQRVMTNSVGESILASTESIGIVGLNFFASGSRSFYGHRPIHHPDDLKGMKIRIQPSPSMSRLMSNFGAESVQLDWDQVYTALRLGLVDAAENNVTALIVGKHAEVVSHYAFNEHTMVPDVFLISAARWQSLPAQQRIIMREAALASYHRMNELWVVFEADSRRKSEQRGVTFTYPDKQPFIERATVGDISKDRALDDMIGRIARS
jgi:tripartite ATP-independent transporter DctP family solute receptor